MAESNGSLDIQDYLDASGDAAKRTRTLFVTLVVASVLVFSGFVNSLNSSWMHQRLLTLARNDADGLKYREAKIGPAPPLITGRELSPEDKRERDEYRDRYNAFYSALARLYAENAAVIRIPFFGITLDANDIGAIGGFGILVILVILRFSLAREVDNLIISFDEARRLDKLDQFYHLLAMLQVFTVPKTKHTERRVKRGKFLIRIPKVICLLPFIVLLCVVINDMRTASVAQLLGNTHAWVILLVECVVCVLVGIGSAMCIVKLIAIDRIWDEMWNRIKDPKYSDPQSYDYRL